MKRRNLLVAAGGSLVSLSGCAGSVSSAPSETPSSTDHSTTTASLTRRNCNGEAQTVGSNDLSNPDEALVVEPCLPVKGTNVNVGVQGVAKNLAGQWLVDCVIDVAGVVGGQTFHARATRSPLSPKGVWEWKVPFGKAADDLQDDSPERIEIGTRARYMDMG